jgi:hypothetical protein
MIAELSPKFMLTKKTYHATPAGCRHTGLRAVHTTDFRPRLIACASVGPGRDSDARAANGVRSLAGDGGRDGAPFHQLSSGIEGGVLVDPLRGADFVRGAPQAAGPLWRDDRPRGRRYLGTPLWTEDRGERLLPGRCTLFEEPRDPVFRSEIGLDDATRSRALEPAGVGVPLSHHAVLAGQGTKPAMPQYQCRLGVADDEAGAPLAARPTAGAGRRWRFRRGCAGPGVCEAPGGHGLALALECGALSPTRPAAQEQTRAQTLEGGAPTELAELGRARRYPLGRPWKWTGTGASRNHCGCSPVPPSGTLRACRLSPFATY